MTTSGMTNAELREQFQIDGGGSGLVAWLCRLLALLAPFGRRVISGRGDLDPYLLRVYLTPRWAWCPRLYLHFFFRGDDEPEYHNHPWHWARALILTRGYLERIYVGHLVRCLVRRRPGHWNKIGRNTFHRVELSNGRCWTLFFAGPRVNLPEAVSWGFMDFRNGRYLHWQAHIKKKGASCET